MAKPVITIGIIVDGRTEQEAREAAACALTRMALSHQGGFGDFRLKPTPAQRIAQPEGRALARHLWGEQMKDYQRDCAYIKSQTRRPLEELLEDLNFRAACLRLGSLDYPPVRLFHAPGGINSPSGLDMVLAAYPDDLGNTLVEPVEQWLVMAEIR